MARQSRECAAHQDGRDEHHQGGQHETQQQLLSRRLEDQGRDRDITRAGRRDQQGQRQAVRRNGELEHHIGAKGSSAPVDTTSDGHGADGKSAHEDSEHRRLGVGGCADHTDQQLGPDHLVHEPGEATQ